MLIPLDYLVKKYSMHPKGVVHIGANEGQEMDDYVKAGIKHFWWIESIPDVYQKMVKHVRTKPHTVLVASNELLSDIDNENVYFNIANNGGQSSSMLDFGTHSKAHPEVKFINKIKLKTKRFDTLVNEIMTTSISQFDFLNIDVQGAELKVLKGMGEYLHGFKWLYLEVNKAELYKGCPMVEEIDEYVKSFGFERVETKWTNWGWGDCLMIKR